MTHPKLDAPQALDSDPVQRLQDLIWETLSRETGGASEEWSNVSIETVVAILNEFTIAPRSPKRMIEDANAARQVA
jgi:hypothetical protein